MTHHTLRTLLITLLPPAAAGIVIGLIALGALRAAGLLRLAVLIWTLIALGT